jgi:hypothetical protein
VPKLTHGLLASDDTMEANISYLEVYRKRRYVNYFRQRLSIFDSVQHTDVMMEELRLRTERKRMRMSRGLKRLFDLKAWFAEWFETYFASDYKWLV